MMNHKKTKIPTAAVLIMALFTASFTSHAAAMIPEEEVSVNINAEVNEVSETSLLSDSSEMISSTIESAVNEGEKAAQKKKEEKERKEAEERARRAAEELLASIIYCEAGNQPYKGQVAVGAVILNRVQSSSYPNSIEAVIYQKGQFGPARTGKLDRVRSAKSYTSTNLQAARDALSGVDPVKGCLYFGCGNKGIKIGGHYFH
ncbi:MAG: cell wall hydrolase [Dorea sp.]